MNSEKQTGELPQAVNAIAGELIDVRTQLEILNGRLDGLNRLLSQIARSLGVISSAEERNN